MASSSNRQYDMLERLSRAIENIDMPSLTSLDMTTNNSKSMWKTILVIIGVLTSLTIMGTCFFFIYKSLI